MRYGVLAAFLFFLGSSAWWWAGWRRFSTWNWDWRFRDPGARQDWSGTPRPRGVQWEIVPQEDLADRPLQLFRVTGLVPGQKVAIRAISRDAKGRVWVAAGIWQADARGVVDLKAQAPLAGTYHRADPWGLLWSMRPQRPMRAPLFARPEEAWRIEVQVEVDGEVLAQSWMVRRFRSAGVRCQEVRENHLVGTYCRPAGKGPFPGLLLLGGSEGGHHPESAAWWASHGVAAFSLAYFGVAPCPKPWPAFRWSISCRDWPGCGPGMRWIPGGFSSRGLPGAAKPRC